MLAAYAGTCLYPIYDVANATAWNSGSAWGTDTSSNNGGCHAYHPSTTVGFVPGGTFDRSSSTSVTWSVGVTLPMTTLTAQSGFSTNVKLHYQFGTWYSNYYLCGDTAMPSASQRVFAGG